MPASGGGKPRPPSIGSGPLEELVGRKEREPFRRAARLGCGLPRVTLRRAPEAAEFQRAEGESLALLQIRSPYSMPSRRPGRTWILTVAMPTDFSCRLRWNITR